MSELKTVIFLGAGASAADGAPVQTKLLPQYFQLPRKERKIEKDPLPEFFERFYGIDVNAKLDGAVFPSFEDALGILELALARSETFKDFGRSDLEMLRRTRDALIFSIGVILRKTLGSRRNTNHYRLLGTPGFENVTLISLNYDLLIDSALAGCGYWPEYGANLLNNPKYGEPAPLYKLHGSLNWLRCPACSSLTCTPNRKGASYPESERAPCANCKSATVPIVIPPTFFKVMSDFHLQQIWHAAELALTNCDRIVFCGYSLPDADVHIKYLLKRAEINAGKNFDVFVINNHKGKSDDQKKSEKLRYERAFADGKKVKYTDYSFEQFAKQGLGLIGARSV